MFIAWGASGTVFFNDACQPLVAAQSANAMGQPAQTLFTGQWKTLGPVFDQVMLGKPVNLPKVTCSINRSGYPEAIPFTFSCIPIHNEAGKTGGMLMTATENTLPLVADHKKIYDILLQLPLGILIVRMPDYKVELVNDSFLQVIGGQVSRLTGQHLYQAIPELKGQSLEQLIDQVLQSGQPHMENGLPVQVESNGKQAVAYFNFLFYPLLEADGAVNGVMLVGREVTDHVLERKRMEKSEQYFRRLADTIPVMLWITRPDGHCTYVNQKWYEYTGKTPNTTLAYDWLSVVHEDDIEQMQRGFQEAHASQVPFSL
jgi:PAS domain-containing protein